MRLLNAHVRNFGSYKDLDFDFQNQGLCLIAGPTGAGKTTLMDIVPWVLFGVTAKGGSVDEVCSWNSSNTSGQLVVNIRDANITIYRSRSPNDLFYIVDDGDRKRGKDTTDTQKQLNELLGADADYYLTSAYYHSFSQTAAFFTLNAKQRRQITEQLVDLGLANNLLSGIVDSRKDIKKQRDDLVQQQLILSPVLDSLGARLDTLATKEPLWEDKHKVKMQDIRQQANNFEANVNLNLTEFEAEHIKRRVLLEYEIKELEEQALDKTAIDNKVNEAKAALDSLAGSICSECGSDTSSHDRLKHTHTLNKLEREQTEALRSSIALKQVRARLDTHNAKLGPALAKLQTTTNVYLEQHKSMLLEANPYTEQLQDTKNEYAIALAKRQTNQYFIDELSEDLADLDTLTEVHDTFRSALIQSSVARIQDGTNKLLTDHFDAVIRIDLVANEKDKLDITIHKDGNVTSYGRLSKGQQQQLKMTFAITVMRVVAMHNNSKISALFLDELGEGLDDELKLKMYGLLQVLSLEYESVFCIDHNEALKSMFTKRYEVSLIDGVSQIEEQ